MQLLEFSVLVWILIRQIEFACIMAIENCLVERHKVVKRTQNMNLLLLSTVLKVVVLCNNSISKTPSFPYMFLNM